MGKKRCKPRPTRERIEVYKKTHDEWYPEYQLATKNWVYEKKIVEVSFLELTRLDEKPQWRCCVWGADDDGRDFDSYVREEAWKMFLTVIAMEYVDKKVLEKLGFINA